MVAVPSPEAGFRWERRVRKEARETVERDCPALAQAMSLLESLREVLYVSYWGSYVRFQTFFWYYFLSTG